MLFVANMRTPSALPLVLDVEVNLVLAVLVYESFALLLAEASLSHRPGFIF